MKPLRLDTNKIVLLDRSMWKSACHVCDKTQSRWGLVSSPDVPPSPICSLCFLYSTKWGIDRRDVLDSLIDEITSKKGGRPILRDENGKIASAENGDFIIGIVAMTSRRFDIEDEEKAKAEAK